MYKRQAQDGVTWYSYNGPANGNDPWNTPGGDYEPEIIDSVPITENYRWYEWNITSAVQDLSLIHI